MPTDSSIEALNLAHVARDAAYALKATQPSVIFASGRRTRGGQALAMAQNIVNSGNRKWISDTYVATEASTACQAWVDENPTATTVTQLNAGLTTILNGLTEAQVGKLSKHLSGMAFDVEPVVGVAGAAIKAAILDLPNLEKFIENEGGLVRWHAQFQSP